MNHDVRITAAAAADVEAIVARIREQGEPRNAARRLQGWIESLRRLERLPRGFRKAPERVACVELRQLVHAGFRTVFTVRGRSVFVLHVRRGTRRSARRGDLGPGLAELGSE